VDPTAGLDMEKYVSNVINFTEKNRRAERCRIVHGLRIKNVYLVFILYQVLCYSGSIWPQCILFKYSVL
jgi:hypothetical protein